MIKHQKPLSFYETFERKGPGQEETHYCPGCGHGTAQKLIAEAIDALGIQDRVIMHSPVGCAVFAYYYFDTGNIQCSHGRAPAVATGIRRTLDDAVIISYQGDGDLAGIGMAEIMHAANRGENITVFFINNAIYGMTGGQMAPTTLLGQKTMTTPLGRNEGRDGRPIGMCEVMNSLDAPVYIERVAFGTSAEVMGARKAIRKGLENQVERKGFSFIEILSPCPVNWKMDPVSSRRWIVQVLEKHFPVDKFRDRTLDQVSLPNHNRLEWMDDKHLVDLLRGEDVVPECKRASTSFSEQRVKIAGFGGQGVLSAGVLLAQCAVAEGLEVSWLPSYGPEMRGGHAYASVIMSEQNIGSPVVDQPNVLIAMNGPSLDAFEDSVESGGWIFVNSSIVTRKVQREDVNVCCIPATDIAKEEKLLAAANVVMAAAYLHKTGIISLETMKAVIPISVKKSQFVKTNLMLIDKAGEFL
ncbi:MAG: 2-oxoacid:acceptor oxidoreductase family protein [Spirochaetales bacterium]|jgi:2-oxoisovalerate ferredoxin oxidoreductase beta subunit|nr:2-oxoacid:acceptor oxidoreductase family protein [Spirochaetales bacterium]